MARTKKPTNETDREAEVRRIMEHMANVANRSEKTSWNRKMDNMVKMLASLEPVENEILDLIRTKKTPIMDGVSALRETMVRECVHPFEYLTMVDGSDVVTCKFCNRKISVPEWMTK